MMLDLQLVYRCNETFKALHQKNIFESSIQQSYKPKSFLELKPLQKTSKKTVVFWGLQQSLGVIIKDSLCRLAHARVQLFQVFIALRISHKKLLRQNTI